MTTATSRPSEADAVSLVPFAKSHLAGALKLSKEIAWPYRLEDWDFALQVGRGFILERDGEVIGTAAWFPYGDDHATMGMIIVSSAAQGRGYGSRLMNALLEAAGPRTIVLNATEEGRPLYERRGFTPIGMIEQHQGHLRQRQDAPPESVVRSMRPTDFEAVSRLDREATSFERRRLLQRLIEAGDGFVLLRNGEPAGYAISRLFGRGHVVGPVVAETVDGARLLARAALARLEGRLVRIDTSDVSDFGPWLTELGLPQISDALTMVRGSLPPTGPSRLFALSNQSFT